jgi:glycosyltransferase involved in cell wall biosynthesis
LSGLNSLAVVVINDLSHAKGGASAIAIENAMQIAKAGGKVTFLSADGHVNQTLLDCGVTCHSMPGEAINAQQPLKGFFRGLHNKKGYDFLRSWLIENDSPDTVYHLHGWSKIWSPSVFAALQPVVNRLVVHAHDYFPVCPNGAFIHYATSKTCDLTPCGIRCLTSACDQRSYPQKLWRFARSTIRNHWVDFSRTKAKVILLHDSMRPFYLRGDFNDDQLVVVPNPVTPYAEHRIAAENNRHFVYIGRLVPEKGVDVFLEASKSANQPAIVIGDGPDRTDLEARFPEAKFVGWQDHAGILQYLQNARVVVLPSKLRETFGLAAVSAIASGVPVIVSEFSALANDIERLGLGRVLPMGNLEGWVSVIQTLAESNDLIHEMSQRGITQWKSLGLTPEDWKNRLIALYSDMLGH